MSKLKTRIDELSAEFAGKLVDAIKTSALNEIVELTATVKKNRGGRPKGSKNKPRAQ